MSSTFSDFVMADAPQPTSHSDFLNAPLDFENGFGFSPATSPAREGKADFSSYFLNDPLPYIDQNDGDFFDNYTHSSQMHNTLSTNVFSTVNAKMVNGQVTPPSDNSPVTPKPEILNEPSPVSLDTEKPVQQPSRKKRGSQQSQASQVSTRSAPKRRKSSARKSSTDTTSSVDGQDEKRSKFLERNRIAASKCRQKKKEWTSNLEQRARDLQQNKANLSLLVNSLRDEVLYLKGEVLKHDTCDCTALRNYMSRSVSQISGEPMNSKVQIPAAASPITDLDLDGMSFTGSPSLRPSAASPATATSPS